MVNNSVKTEIAAPYWNPQILVEDKPYKILKTYQMTRLCLGHEDDSTQTRQVIFHSIVNPKKPSAILLVPAMEVYEFVERHIVERFYARQPDPEKLMNERGTRVFNPEQIHLRNAVGCSLREMCLRPLVEGTTEQLELHRADKAGGGKVAKLCAEQGRSTYAYVGLGRPGLTHYEVVAPIPNVHWVAPAPKTSNRVRSGRVEKGTGAGKKSGQNDQLARDSN